MTIGDRIKEVRRMKKCTQQELADTLNLKRQTIAAYEIGTVTPSDRTLSDICRIFCVNEVWLRTGEGEPFVIETREEQITRFAMQTIKGSDEFQKAFVSMLSRLDADDWDKLAEIFEKLSDELKKGE